MSGRDRQPELTPPLLGHQKATLGSNSSAFGSAPTAEPQPFLQEHHTNRLPTATKFSSPNVFILTTNWLISCNMTAVTLIWHIWLRLRALKIWNCKVLVPTATTGSNYPGSANFQNRRNICLLQPPSKCTAKDVSLHQNSFISFFCVCISICTLEIFSI